MDLFEQSNKSTFIRQTNPRRHLSEVDELRKNLAAKLLIKSTWTQKIFDRAIQELSNGILTYSFQIILTENIVIESSRVLPNYLKLSLVKRFCTLRNVLCTKLSVLL